MHPAGAWVEHGLIKLHSNRELAGESLLYMSGLACHSCMVLTRSKPWQRTFCHDSAISQPALSCGHQTHSIYICQLLCMLQTHSTWVVFVPDLFHVNTTV